MSTEKSSDPTLEMLEQLDVIEARELNIGNAFHAFRFRKGMEEVDEQTQVLVEEAAQTLGITLDEFQKLLDEEATESNPFSNFARGVIEAAKVMRK